LKCPDAFPIVSFMQELEQGDQLDELLTCRLNFGRRKSEPCTIVIFGASGDLTVRKLVPALYHLLAGKQLPSPFRIIGFARREKSNEAFRTEMKEGLEKFSRSKKIDPAVWTEFAANLFYCQGEFGDVNAYKKLKGMIDGFEHEGLRKNQLFYLSTSPSQFAEVVEHLNAADSASWWRSRLATIFLRPAS
jgi:glucose-6-phosphate 1-dehydrogenase